MKFWYISEICSNFANFWARKIFFFFKQIRILPEFYWYQYWVPSPALLGIVRQITKRNTLQLKCLIRTQFAPPVKFSTTSFLTLPKDLVSFYHPIITLELWFLPWWLGRYLLSFIFFYSFFHFLFLIFIFILLSVSCLLSL